MPLSYHSLRVFHLSRPRRLDEQIFPLSISYRIFSTQHMLQICTKSYLILLRCDEDLKGFIKGHNCLYTLHDKGHIDGEG